LPREIVVDKIYKILNKVEVIYAEKEAQIKADADARFEAWKVAYKAGMEQAENDARAAWTENGVLWIAAGIIGTGLVVYGIYKADPAVIATGGVMAASGVFRLVITLK
jgi:hypothetical protein